jgi:hypothetical protein
MAPSGQFFTSDFEANMSDIELSTRPAVYELPSYSLTGDLLSYMRCGLQYRYTRIGKMPSRSPVQLWFGNFIHGAMDEGFRIYKQVRDGGADHDTALSSIDAETVINAVEDTLAAQGLLAWEPWVKTLGYARARVCLAEFGPILFPLIHLSEVRLTGARELAPLPEEVTFREAERYEMVGIIDVVSDIELQHPEVASNPIVTLVQEALGEVPDHFEVIIDYKGSRRPPLPSSEPAGQPSLWDQYEWQVLTYADLRGRQPDAQKVKAGLLIYINELLPLASDLKDLAREAKKPDTDIVIDADEIKGWIGRVREQRRNAQRVLYEHSDQEGNTAELAASLELVGTPIPFDLRLHRSLRIVQTEDPETGVSKIPAALTSFDEVVQWIETCRGKEHHGKSIIDSWVCNATDENTCAACDARTWCPDFTKESTPRLPGVKI